MDRVIFLDRDGTINEEINYLHRPKDLKFLPGVPQAIKYLREHGFSIVVVTNQAGVARGYYQEADVVNLHNYMNERLKEQGAGIDYFFYCPHHPVYGIGKYKAVCRCRKPGIGMFLKAERYYRMDKAHSYMVGDKLADMEAGHNYGIKSVLVGTGYGRETAAGMTAEERKKAFEHYAADLRDAAEWIINEEGMQDGDC